MDRISGKEKEVVEEPLLIKEDTKPKRKENLQR